MAKTPTPVTPRRELTLPSGKKPKTADIIAAEKIIADISSGIYRSPAAALKELVSNAYDADAELVSITTDSPHFRTLTIEDDGVGMTLEKFLQVITHIGGSRKRVDSDRSDIHGRKLIGRIGIGMLAVAQLGNLFYVTSKVKGEDIRFIAEVNLDPFHRDDVALQSMGKLKGEGKVQIGAVRYVDRIPEMRDVQYTVITVPDAKKGLISEMTSAVRKAVGAHERLAIESVRIEDFDKLIDVVRSAQRADLVLDGYYYMLWELALLSPVNYSERGPFDTSARNIEGAETFTKPQIEDFKLLVDSLELRRPQLFPNTKAISYPSPDPKIYPITFDQRISKRRLRFTGYIYSQQPRIFPEELKGVHIRIREVGIGKYDKSWLGYPFDEGIKFGQITGEIFVDEGLEPALNIDRDSFRETDVHYQAMRAYVWDLLRKQVFPDFKQRANALRKEKQRGVQAAHRQRFVNALLELPSPVIGKAKFTSADIDEERLFEIDGDTLVFNKKKWEEFCSENEIFSDEVKERFLRVVAVLAASELLVDSTGDEVVSLLRAIAVAVQ
jgi:hypothetical protein